MCDGYFRYRPYKLLLHYRDIGGVYGWKQENAFKVTVCTVTLQLWRLYMCILLFLNYIYSHLHLKLSLMKHAAIDCDAQGKAWPGFLYQRYYPWEKRLKATANEQDRQGLLLVQFQLTGQNWHWVAFTSYLKTTQIFWNCGSMSSGRLHAGSAVLFDLSSLSVETPHP